MFGSFNLSYFTYWNSIGLRYKLIFISFGSLFLFFLWFKSFLPFSCYFNFTFRFFEYNFLRSDIQSFERPSFRSRVSLSLNFVNQSKERSFLFHWISTLTHNLFSLERSWILSLFNFLFVPQNFYTAISLLWPFFWMLWNWLC